MNSATRSNYSHTSDAMTISACNHLSALCFMFSAISSICKDVGNNKDAWGDGTHARNAWASLRSGRMQLLFCMVQWRSLGGASRRIRRNRFPRVVYTLRRWRGADAATISAYATRKGTARKKPFPVGNPAQDGRRATQKGVCVTAQSYDINVFGQSFTVTSEKSEQEVRMVAAYVDQKMRERARTSKTIMPLRIAIMAALEIADAYLEQPPRGNDRLRNGHPAEV